MQHHSVFQDTIGQDRVKTILSQTIASVNNGGPANSFLLKAVKGNGKSHFARRTMDALRAMGWDTHTINRVRDIRYADSDAWTTLSDLIKKVGQGDGKLALFIDEYHQIHEDSPTVQMKQLHHFLHAVLDKGNQGRGIPWGDDVVNFTRMNLCVIVATNFPAKLDRSGAFQDRFQNVELDLYSEAELVDILQGMISDLGFREVSETTLSMIARCGRGTARPMEKIAEQLDAAHRASGKATKTINREDVIAALHLKKMFPQGLDPHEVKMLEVCKSNPKTDTVILANLPSVERQTLNHSKGYLISKEFAIQGRGGFCTTTKGEKYLEQIKKDKFIA